MYTYDGNGNLASVIKSAENTVTYIYDDKDNLLSFTDQNDVTTSYTYDDKSNLIKTTLPNGAVITNTYDSNNRLKTSTDERNTVTEYTYDNDGNTTSVKITPSDGTPITARYVYTDSKMTSSTDFNGNTTGYTYNADGNIKSVTDALNHTTSYEYDEDKRLVKVTYPSGHTEKYTYDNKGNVRTYTDKNGNVTTNVYDANNNLFTTSKGNALTTFTYDKEDRVLKAEDNTGAVEYEYDGVGNVVSEKDKNGNVTDYAYDEFNRLVQQTIGGATTKYTLDYTDRLVGVTDPYNNVTAYTYDNMGNLTEVTNSLGKKTLMAYDASGNMRTVKTPLGNTYSYTYDFRGNKVTEKDAKNYKTAYEYDDNGNLTKVTDPMGGITEYTYDPLNRQATVKNANGSITTYAYDDVNSASSITLPDSQVYSYTYDGNGNVLTANEGSGIVKTTYDYNNKPLTITDALNNKVEYTYDALGNPLTYKTARGNTYTYAYDGNGNLKTETDPLNGVVTYNYNAFNTATSFKDANGNKTDYEYDLLNRLKSETSAAGAKDNYTYDALSQLTKYTNKRGQSIEYTYDADGNTTGRKTPEDVVIYNYDENGNLLTIEDKNGKITRLYDSLNRIVSYTNAAGQTIGYEYDSVGNLKKLTYPDGKTVTYAYNSVNQMTSVTDWNDRVTNYNYENGRLKTIVRPDGSHEVYNYDAKGQLLTVTDLYANGNTINQYYFVYDADGNIKSENSFNEPDADSISVDSSAMTYGAANQLINFNGTPIAYDADGNMLSTPLDDKLASLTYDSLNYLTNVAVGEEEEYSYTYDAEGYRTAKNENGVVTNFTVNPNAELSQVLMSTKNGETTYYVYGLGLISQENSDGYRLYHYDYRGSTTAITNLNGEVTDTVFYDPYGNVVSRTGNTETSFLYVGKHGVETDNSGLYYMRARYYNPQIQRFVNIDPIRDGYNWYGYCDANPIGYVDAAGKNPAIVLALYAYANALVMSPDIQMDIELMAMDWSSGNGFAFALDAIGTAIPGVTGLGKVGTEATTAAGKVISRYADDTFKPIYRAINSKMPTTQIKRYLSRRYTNETIDTVVNGLKSERISKLWYDIIDTPSSTKLARELKRIGDVIPDFEGQAHHIVAGTSERAAKAREVLRKYGVSINNAANGVYLPVKEGVDDAIIHSKTFTKKYYNEVNRLLEKADSREEVLAILKEIKEKLINGDFFDIAD